MANCTNCTKRRQGDTLIETNYYFDALARGGASPVGSSQCELVQLGQPPRSACSH